MKVGDWLVPGDVWSMQSQFWEGKNIMNLINSSRIGVKGKGGSLQVETESWRLEDEARPGLHEAHPGLRQFSSVALGCLLLHPSSFSHTSWP